jgi:pimeloyl-ACP methyl ester carboxylesterase
MLRINIFILLLCIIASKVAIASSVLSEQPCSYKEYSAICGQVKVPEDHLNPTDRTIELPYQLIRGSLPEGAFRPVVLALGGGPGMSNMEFAPSKEVLEVSDVLLVGFRGVDGSVDLSCPEVDAAFSKERRLFAPQSQANIQAAFSLCLARLREQDIDISVFNPQQSVEDMDAVRKVLGIDKVSILSGSFGTRLAQYYAIQHPQAIERMVLVATNPPGRFVWEPDLVDSIMQAYGINNAPAVFAAMPESWMSIDLDPARIGISSFAMLYSTDSAAMVINAFKDAAKGDYAGLAMLSLTHDMMVSGMMNWGHLMLMAGSVDFDNKRDYNADLKANNHSFGSPMARFLWTMITADTISVLPADFRALKPITTPTLVIGGSLDISTPAVLAERELMPYLKNGSLLRVGNAGHYDLWRKPVRKVFASYLADGTKPTDFDLAEPSYEPGFFTLSRIAKIAPVALFLLLIMLVLGTWFLVGKVRKS